MSERGVLITQGSRERRGRLCVVAQSDSDGGVMPPSLTVTGAVVVIEEQVWRAGVYRKAFYVWKRSCAPVLSDEMWRIYLRPLAVI